MTPLLDVRHLAKSFGGVHAVADVSFAVAAGEIVALIGPNGAGKSTCFNLLTGQIAADRGEVRIAGTPALGRRPSAIWALGVGRTFQITTAFSSMTTRENVETALISYRKMTFRLWPSRDQSTGLEADRLLALVGLAAEAGRPATELAYGDLKRLDLAMVLASRPRLLLMDEPTAGMAPAERRDLMAMVVGIARAERLGVLFTEHDMDVVFDHADRIMVLAHGQLVAEGAPDAVRADARVRDLYLGHAAAGREATP